MADPEIPRKSLLPFSVISELADAVQRLERDMERPVDVEWALSLEGLFFVQVRAQTRPLEPGLLPGEMWSRVNVRDTYPEIPSAFARSMLELVMDPGVRDHLQGCGTPVDSSIPLLTTVFGRPVLNERICLPGDLLGIPRSALQVDFGGAVEVDDRIGSADFFRFFAHPVVLLRSTVVALNAARRAAAWLTQTASAGEELERIDADSAAPHELLDVIRRTSSEVGRGMVRHAMALAAGVSNAQYMALLPIRDHPEPRALLTRLVGGEEPTVSTQQLDDLVSLAREICKDRRSERFTEEVTPAHEERVHWEHHLSPAVWRQAKAWTARFGHRGPFESDLSSPRYSEDLCLFARTLFPIVRAVRNGHPIRNVEGRAEEANLAWHEVEIRWGARRARRMRGRVKHLGALLRLRERLRSETVRSTNPLRHMVLELGRRLKRDGRLEHATDVWHLSLDDLYLGFRNPGFPLDMVVAGERSRRAAWQRIEVPNRFTSGDLEHFSRSSPAAEKGSVSRTLRGNGVSPGIVEGKVTVLRSPAEAQRMELGSVMVARATDPGWTPLFAQAVAVVVELGGALSHAGIVAREFGIPCVANIQGVTHLLRTGDSVLVDGSAGTVTLLSRPIGPLHWAGAEDASSA